MRPSFKTGGLRKPATPDLYTSGQRNMTFKQASGEEVPGYLVSKLTHAYSGVVMLQEWWGLNASIQKLQINFLEVILEFWFLIYIVVKLQRTTKKQEI